MCRTKVHGNGRGVEMVKKNCATCGKEIETWPCLAETKKYCSVACRASNPEWVASRTGPEAASWRGGNGTYWKRKARERDGCCKRCGVAVTGRRLHAHHLHPVVLGGPDSLDNLVSLCDVCHQTVEKMFYTELLAAAPPGTLDRVVSKIRESLSIAGGSQ